MDMDTHSGTDRLVSHTGMLIRRPIAEVFEAMVNPDMTTQFWFTRSSGRLHAGRQVDWEWEMYAVAITVTVTVIELNRRIVIEWPAEQGQNVVEWTFAPHDGSTFVSITETMLSGTPTPKQVADSTEGFTVMLAGLKALLEYGIRLNLIADRFPHGLEVAE